MTLLRKTGTTIKRSTLVPRGLQQDVPQGLTRRAFLARAGLVGGTGLLAQQLPLRVMEAAQKVAEDLQKTASR